MSHSQMTVYEYIDHIVKEESSKLPRYSYDCCIYSVPRHLRAANEAAYTPHIVSIGPLHCHADHLQHTRPHKFRYLNSFLQAKDLQTYCDIITNNLTRIQDSYADPAVRLMDTHELVMIVLVDAAFLIELFRRNCYPRLIEASDQMFYGPRMVEKARHDFWLVENQLPWFILRELYDAAYGGQADAPSFMKIVCEFLGIPFARIDKYYDTCKEGNCLHFPDLLRTNYLSPLHIQQRLLSRSTFLLSLPEATIMCKTATALLEAGVKFRVAEDGLERCLLDIEFDEQHGTLVIPRIDIRVDTETLFQSLAVYEQLHYYPETYFIDYILFLDSLISTPADVALLEKHSIIVNWLGSDERVVELFSGLNRQLKLKSESCYYAMQCWKLNAFYKKRWNRYFAVLKLKYFDHPWAVIAVGYAVVMLLLAVAQVISGFMSLK